MAATLTAMSADDGCGGWVVGGVVAVAERVDSLALEVESDVSVDASGDADGGAVDLDGLFQEQVAVECRRSWNRSSGVLRGGGGAGSGGVSLVGSSGLPFGVLMPGDASMG